MPEFISKINKFKNKGEKTGWNYVNVPDDIIIGFKLKNKKEFRVKGFIDNVEVQKLNVYPIGGGKFIIAINNDLRKKLQKGEGDTLGLNISIDESEAQKSEELLLCLEEDNVAKSYFDQLNKSNQNYFHRYIFSAKGIKTKEKRTIQVMNALNKKLNFGEMIRLSKEKKP